MNTLCNILYVCLTIFMLVFFVDASPILAKKWSGPRIKSTLAMPVEQILEQLKDSKFAKDKEKYNQLVTDLKKHFHTTPEVVRRAKKYCKKCARVK